jgi:hypothetical protein
MPQGGDLPISCCGVLSSADKLFDACRYVEDSGVVSQKGRVAAEIQSADELLLTELIFTGGLTVRCHLWHLRYRLQTFSCALS